MNCSDFLFAMPSFFGGMSHVLDLGSTLTEYNRSRSEKEADLRALHCDWQMVGQDIYLAIAELRKELDGKK